jgi:hypothetical protein
VIPRRLAARASMASASATAPISTKVSAECSTSWIWTRVLSGDRPTALRGSADLRYRSQGGEGFETRPGRALDHPGGHGAGAWQSAKLLMTAPRITRQDSPRVRTPIANRHVARSVPLAPLTRRP